MVAVVIVVLSSNNLYFACDWPKKSEEMKNHRRKNPNGLKSFFSTFENHLMDHQFCVTVFKRLQMHAIYDVFALHVLVRCWPHLDTSIYYQVRHISVAFCQLEKSERNLNLNSEYAHRRKLLTSTQFNRHSIVYQLLFSFRLPHIIFINHALIKYISIFA